MFSGASSELLARARAGAVRVGLRAVHRARLHRLLEPREGATGAILALHQVSESPTDEFAPNAPLKISPDFLESIVVHVRRSGFEIVSLDEIWRLLKENDFSRQFVAFTFDDAYRNVLEFAYPIFRKHGAPFTIYVPTDFPAGDGIAWWEVLEYAIGKSDSWSVPGTGLRNRLVRTPTQKMIAYRQTAEILSSTEPAKAQEILLEICRIAGASPREINRNLIMSWEEIRLLSADPLVTFGAHTKGHRPLAMLSSAEARDEIAGSVSRLSDELSREVHHFAFPYGNARCVGEREFCTARELGLRTAVTTRKGILRCGRPARLHALPRIPVNGHFQEIEAIEVLLSGAPFALRDGLWPAKDV